MKIRIHPHPGVLRVGTVLEITINGKTYPPEELKATGIEISIVDVPDGLPAKTPDLCGPAQQAMSSPFALIYGNESDKEQADDFERWWMKFAKGSCRKYSAENMTTDIEASYNLLLFGTPATNSYLKSISGKLPIVISDTSFTLPDGTSVGSEGKGLLFIYPNPNAPHRFVMVASGLNWGANLPLNHRFDFVPDYIIFEGNTAPRAEAESYIVAGFFDTFWRFDPSLCEKRHSDE